MLKRIILLLFVAAATFSVAVPGASTAWVVAQPGGVAHSAQKNEQTVYVTRTGEKYHRDGCRSLKKSRIAIKKSEAIARGYSACKICRP